MNIRPYAIIGTINALLIFTVLSLTLPGVSNDVSDILRQYQYDFFFFLVYGSFVFLNSYERVINKTHLTLASTITSIIIWFTFAIQSAQQFPLFITSAFAANAYMVGFLRNGFKMKYETLFFAVWESAAKLPLIALISLASWLTLILGCSLLRAIGIDLMSFTLFYPFSLAYLFFSACITYYIINSQRNLITRAVSLLLGASRYLLPLLSIFILIFLAASIFVFISNEKLGHGIWTYLSTVMLMIILINGVYQKGEEYQPYPSPLQYFIDTAIALLPLLVFLSLYNIAQVFNIKQLTLTHLNIRSESIIDSVYAILCLLYTFAYSYGIIRKRELWLSNIKRANYYLGYIIIACSLLLNSDYSTDYSISSHSTAQLETRKKIFETRYKQQALDEKAKRAGLIWKKVQTPKELGSGIVLGYRDSKAIHLCRVYDNGAYQAGVTKEGQCQYFLNKHQIKQTVKFSVLSGTPQAIGWHTRWAPIDTSFVFKFINLLPNGSVAWDGFCRTIYNNKIYVGFANIRGYNNQQCNIIINNNKKITLTDKNLFSIAKYN